MDVLPACMYVYCVSGTSGGQRRALDGTGVTEGCEPPRECWESNPGLLQEQQMLLMAEPTLWPCVVALFSEAGSPVSQGSLELHGALELR